MFIPVEDDEGEKLSRGEKKIRAEREMREARKRVQGEIEKWVGFYRGNEKYYVVGRLVDEEEGEVRGLCQSAEEGRPRRSELNRAAAEGGSKGKPVWKPNAHGQGRPV
jgi:hypothetical protein